MRISRINSFEFTGRIKKGDVQTIAKKVAEEKIDLTPSQKTDIIILKSEDISSAAIGPAATTVYTIAPIVAVSQ